MKNESSKTTEPTTVECNARHEHRPRNLKILIWIASPIISGFYVLSACGWFMAGQLMKSGLMGQQATEFERSLSAVDHIMRTAQVILIVAASVSLILARRIAVPLFLISLFVSLFSCLLIRKWSISFLGAPDSLVAIGLVCGYVCWLSRKGLLH